MGNFFKKKLTNFWGIFILSSAFALIFMGIVTYAYLVTFDFSQKEEDFLRKEINVRDQTISKLNDSLTYCRKHSGAGEN